MTWLRSVEPGDWVRTTRAVNVSLTDCLTGAGIPPGARGVVCERSGSRLRVELEHGLSTVSTTIRVRDCRIVRRQGGRDDFHRSAGRRRAVRLGLVVFTCWPLAQFTVLYGWHNRSFDGYAAGLALACLDSSVEIAGHVVADPVQTVLYLGFLAAVGRYAFSG